MRKDSSAIFGIFYNNPISFLYVLFLFRTWHRCYWSLGEKIFFLVQKRWSWEADAICRRYFFKHLFFSQLFWDLSSIFETFVTRFRIHACSLILLFDFYGLCQIISLNTQQVSKTFSKNINWNYFSRKYWQEMREGMFRRGAFWN